MPNAIVVADDERRLIQTVREQTGYDVTRIALLRQKMATSLNCPPEAVSMRDVLTFALTEHALGLDALLNQIYWIKRGSKSSYQVGIDGFRAIADRSGSYAGSEAPVYRGTLLLEEQSKKIEVPAEASVLVRKLVQGHVVGYVGVAAWNEFYPGPGPDGFMYRKMPRHMLGKDAEAQALRKGWPAQLGGVPYSNQIEVAEAAPVESSVPAGTYERIYGEQDELPPAREDLPREATDPRGGEAEPARDTHSRAARAEAWAENRRLQQEAELLGLRPQTLRNDTPHAQVEAYNAELQEQIASAAAKAS